MRNRFRGEEEARLDAKGRLVIPAKFRAVLSEAMETPGAAPEVVIVYGEHLSNHCECYDARSFAAIEDRIFGMPDGHPARDLLEENVLGRSHTLAVDETGRVVLPPKVRARARLPERGAADVYLIGLGNKFRLWSQEVYDEEVGASTRAALGRLPPNFNVMRLIDEPDAIDWA